jgi:hypothetical protein
MMMTSVSTLGFRLDTTSKFRGYWLAPRGRHAAVQSYPHRLFHELPTLKNFRSCGLQGTRD